MDQFREYRRSPSIARRNKLVIQYVRLIYFVIFKSYISYPLFESGDLFAFGVEGLIRAIEKFNPESGVKFETFAIPYIRGKILDEMRKSKKGGLTGGGGFVGTWECCSINELVSGDEFDSYFSKRLIETFHDNLNASELKLSLREALANGVLNDKEKLIIRMLYYEGYEQKEVAKQLALSVQRVSQIKRTAEQKLFVKLRHAK